MIHTYEDKISKELKSDCKRCFGLCCVALYFSKLEGFPVNKEAGKPCVNLRSDFTCSVHKNLKNKGLKGCMAYDCIGAGQKISQITCKGHDWKENNELANKMYEGFLIMRQLHEILWYLTEASILQKDYDIKIKIDLLRDDIEQITFGDIEFLLSLNIETYRKKANILIKNTSEQIRNKYNRRNTSSINKNNDISRRVDYFGADLRKKNLIGADLRGACLIAANLRNTDLSGADLIASDLRDADIRGANLEKSIFITQPQLNAAKGDMHTKIPKNLVRPSCWSVDF